MPITIVWDSYACGHCKTHTGDHSNNWQVLKTYTACDPKRLAIGRQGIIDNELWTIVAYSEQKVIGHNDSWKEYQLVNEHQVYRYLSVHNLHWRIAEEIPNPDPQFRNSDTVIIPNEGTYKLYSRDKFEITYAEGFFQDFKMNEIAIARDFICPPFAMQLEINSDGLHQYKAQTITSTELKQAFSGVYFPGPSTTNPLSVLFSSKRETVGLILGTFLILLLSSLYEIICQEVVTNQSQAIYNDTTPIQSTSFELTKFTQMIIVNATAEGLNNEWLGLGILLVNEDTGEELYTETELSFYSGHDSDGDWEENNKTQEAKFCSIYPGRYLVEIIPYPSGSVNSLNIKVMKGGTSDYAFWLCTALLIILAATAHKFNQYRWYSSDFGS